MIIALDIETNGHGTIDVFRDKILLTSVVTQDGDYQEHLIEGEQYPDWLLEDVQDKSVVKLVHNAAFDMKFIQHKFGVVARNVWDTLATERLLTAGKGFDCDLETVMWRRFSKKLDKSVRAGFSRSQIGDREKEYCLEDSRSLFPLWMQQVKEVKANGQMIAAKLENCMGIVVADMELVGIGFDLDLWNEYVKIIEQKRDAVELDVTRRLGVPYMNGMFGGIRPSVRLTQRDRVLEILTSNGIKLNSYDSDDLQSFVHYSKDRDKAEIVRLILEFKKWDKALDWEYDKKIHPLTGRIHASYNPQGADSFRFTASQPNLQQVVKPFSDDINFRHLFRAKEGYAFVGADYSQIELRILAEVANDPDYIMAFKDGLDLHKMAAEKVLGRPLTLKSERNLGKAVNFGIVAFAGGSRALMNSAADYGIFLTESEAKEYVDTIRRKSPVIERWGKKVLADMQRMGYIQTPIGHRRYLAGELRETVARNTHVSPFAAGIIKDAMSKMFWRLRAECDDTHIVLQVHDELLIECKEGESGKVRDIIVTEMKEAGERWLKIVPVEVDSYISRTWEKG